jgi:hypothetical protein
MSMRSFFYNIHIQDSATFSVCVLLFAHHLSIRTLLFCCPRLFHRQSEDPDTRFYAFSALRGLSVTLVMVQHMLKSDVLLPQMAVWWHHTFLHDFEWIHRCVLVPCCV